MKLQKLDHYQPLADLPWGLCCYYYIAVMMINSENAEGSLCDPQAHGQDKGITREKRRPAAGTQLGKASLTNAGFLSLQHDSLVQTHILMFYNCTVIYSWLFWFASNVSLLNTTYHYEVGLFVCLGGRQGEADELDCNPLQRVGIPFFRDLASRP